MKIEKIQNNLERSFYNILREKLALGESRHQAKLNGEDTSKKIYSSQSFKNYVSHSKQFAKFCAENGCRNTKQAEKNITKFLDHLKETGYSAASQATYKSTLAKLFDKEIDYKTDIRERANITNNRGESKAYFSEKNNHDLVNFCQNTGLRRCEVQKVKGTDLRETNGIYYVHVASGKGGKERFARIAGQKVIEENGQKTIQYSKECIEVMQLMRKKGMEKVFGKVNNKAPIHRYRQNYADKIYKENARPVDKIPREERYDCRKDRAGESFDKKAMLIVSKNLGHNRIDVIANSYLFIN